MHLDVVESDAANMVPRRHWPCVKELQGEVRVGCAALTWVENQLQCVGPPFFSGQKRWVARSESRYSGTKGVMRLLGLHPVPITPFEDSGRATHAADLDFGDRDSPRLKTHMRPCDRTSQK